MNLLFCHRSQQAARRRAGFAHIFFWMRSGGAELQSLRDREVLAVVAKQAALLQRAHQRFELPGDFFRGGSWRERDRGTYSDGDFADVGETTVFALHPPDAVEAHWNYRDAKIFCEEPDAALERCHAAIFGIIHFAFGKNEHAVAAVDRFAGKAKAFAEAGKLRQRKNVEEQGGEPVAELISPAPGEEPITRRAAHVLQRFATHGRGEAGAGAPAHRG